MGTAVVPYEHLVRMGVVHRRVEQISEQMAAIADELSATITGLCGVWDRQKVSDLRDCLDWEFYEQLERDIDRRVEGGDVDV